MDLPPKRLLFVDDEPNILDTLRRLLHQCKENWDPSFCSGVDEALAALNSVPFDVVVSDIRMPGKDGFALLEAMRADAVLRRIPVVILTGDADRGLKRRALESGASDLLNKPINSDDLIARIRSSLRLKSYQDQLENQVDVLDGLVRARTAELERTQREVVWRLAKAGEFRDDETGNHVARVASYACELAEGLGMKPARVDLILQTSPLHDIGKIGIPDSILLKPGKLTREETETMRNHTLIGEKILRSTPKAASIARHKPRSGTGDHAGTGSVLIDLAASIARSHHEKWDGSGYPDGLSGKDIPIEARIVAVSDVFDALMSKRPYKDAMPESDALEFLSRERNRHFDPDVVDVFLERVDKIRAIRELADAPVDGTANSGPYHETNHLRR